jgi:agmatine deiminase
MSTIAAKLLVNGFNWPAFADSLDAAARATLRLFSDRRELAVPKREMLLGSGNVHCITQQERRGRR